MPASGNLDAVLELDDLFTPLAFSLNAESAARLIEQFAVESLGHHTCGLHHHVERLRPFDRAGQDQEQAG